MRYVLAGFAGALLAVFLLGAAPQVHGVIRCRGIEVVDERNVERVFIKVADDGGGAVLVMGGDSADSGSAAIIANDKGSSVGADVVFAKVFSKR